ncbi:MAG: AraC family transcriptional regulator [Eubacterium sp.]
MNINSNFSNDNLVTLVDYRNNKSLSRYGVACHWWNSETTSLHCHNFYEFFIVTSGEAFHEINGEHRKLHKGTLQLIQPKDRHRIVSSQWKRCTHINISVTPEKLEKICNATDISVNELVENAEAVTSLSVSELENFIKKAERISLMYFNSDEKFRVLICEMIVDAVCILYKNMISSRLDCPEWFTDTLDKIHSPKYCDCSANDVYQLAGFSPPVVIEQFKKYTGKTVVEYLKSIKMNKACELLKNTETPIIEISNILGYASLSHFNRVFKDYLGITPAAYRKSKEKEINIIRHKL